MKWIAVSLGLLSGPALLAADAPTTKEPEKAAVTAVKSTLIRSHDLFEFEMPGEWTAVPGKKADLGGGKLMYPGMAKGPAMALAYFAFFDPKTKVSEVSLKEFPWIVVQPLHENLIKTGGKEVSRTCTALNEGSADQEYFSYVLAGPKGETIVFNGIVLRTKKRVYVIQAVEKKATEVKVWREIAKSFKEV